MSRLNLLAVVIFLVGLLAAGRCLVLRARAEQQNRAVQLVIDYSQLRLLSAVTGHPLPQALKEFRDAGAGGVAVSEEQAQDLVTSGRIEMESTTTSRGGTAVTRLRVQDEATLDRLRQAVLHRMPRWPQESEKGPVNRVLFTGPGGKTLEVRHARWEDLRQMPVGLDPVELDAVKTSGLEPVARVSNFISATPESIAAILASLKQQQVRTVIFLGEDILGFKGRLAETAAALRANGLQYGFVEFGKQRGDEALAHQAQDILVRVHSVPSGELVKMSDAEVIDRYARAVDERTIRICYVRLPVAVSEDTYAQGLDYIENLSAELGGAGFTLKSAHPLQAVWDDPLTGRLAAAVVAAGVGAAALLLLALLLPLSRAAEMALCLVFSAAAAGVVMAGGDLGRQMVAFGAALVFPCLAFLLFPQPLGALEEHVKVKPRSPVMYAVSRFAGMSLVSLLGALMVAALLSERQFMLQVKGFMGIKAAHLLPILLIGVIYWLGPPERGRWMQHTVSRLSDTLSRPVAVWQALLSLLALAAFAMLLLRTGNEPGVGVSPLEMRFRALLDEVLVRPRTKEFLIGHPALVLALFMAAIPRWRRLAFAPLMVGAIGQVSIINSFCHIHTPLAITFWRTFNGLWLGLLIGLVLVGFAALLQNLLPTQPEHRPVDGRIREHVTA